MEHQIMTFMLDAFLIINALPPKFLQNAPPPTFSMVLLFHRLYGVDAPGASAGLFSFVDDCSAALVVRLSLINHQSSPDTSVPAGVLRQCPGRWRAL